MPRSCLRRQSGARLGAVDGLLFYDQAVDFLVSHNSALKLSAYQGPRKSERQRLGMLRLEAQTYLNTILSCSSGVSSPAAPSRTQQSATKKVVTFSVIRNTTLTVDQSSLHHERTLEQRHRAPKRGVKRHCSLGSTHQVTLPFRDEHHLGVPYGLCVFLPKEISPLRWRAALLGLSDRVREALAEALPPLDRHLGAIPFTPGFFRYQIPNALSLGFRLHLFNKEAHCLQGFLKTLSDTISGGALATVVKFKGAGAGVEAGAGAQKGAQNGWDPVVEISRIGVAGVAKLVQGAVDELYVLQVLVTEAAERLRDLSKAATVAANALMAAPNGNSALFPKGVSSACATVLTFAVEGLAVLDKVLRGHVDALREACGPLQGQLAPEPAMFGYSEFVAMLHGLRVWHGETSKVYKLWYEQAYELPKVYRGLQGWMLTPHAEAWQLTRVASAYERMKGKAKTAP